MSVADRSARAIAFALCLVAACLQGCDGIGRELVDRQPARSGNFGCAEFEIPECDDPERDFGLDGGIPLGATPVDLAACGGGVARPASEAAALAHAQHDCENLRVVLDPSAGALVVQETDLSNVSLAIESATKAALTLDHGTFEHVFIGLEGPVTLRITNAVVFDDVGIQGRANAGGVPRVELIEVRGGEVAIGEAEQAFPGQLDMVRSTLDDAHLRAEGISLSSVRVNHAAIESRNLTAADTLFVTSTLALGYATFAASQLSAVHVDTCDALVFISATITGSEIPACDVEPLRAYSTQVSKSSIDGTIDSDASHWDKVRFGLHAPTELLGWGTAVSTSAFCDYGRRLRFGEDSNAVSCSSCMAETFSEPLCVFADGVVEAGGNTCADLAPLGDAGACPGMRPTRPRP